MRAIGSDQVVGPMLDRSLTRLEGCRDAVGVLRQRCEAVAAMDRDIELSEAGLEQVLDLGLADVDERREVLVRVGQMDLEQLAAAVVRAADAPPDPALRNALPDSQALPDLERLALHADRLGTNALARPLGLEDLDRRAVLGEAAGQGEAHGAGPDDDDVHVRRQSWSASQTWRSRSAVQMRGWSMPSSSSQARCTLNGMVCSKIGKPA